MDPSKLVFIDHTAVFLNCLFRVRSAPFKRFFSSSNNMSTTPKDVVLHEEEEVPSPTAAVPDKGRADSFGASRTIGLFGGVCMLTNIVVGPGIVAFPALFHSAGWLVCITSILLYSFIALLNSWMTLYSHNSISKRNVSGERLEFIDLCQRIFPPWSFYGIYVFYVLQLVALCVASILQVWQMTDYIVQTTGIFGENKTCGLMLWPRPLTWYCGTGSDDSNAFPAGSGVLSVGYFVCAIVTMPFGFFPLEDSITYQSVCTMVMFCAIFIWIGSFISKGLDRGHMPAIGSNFSGLIGTTLFNFALPFTLPSWNNERKLSVRPVASCAAAIAWGSSAMVLLGAFAALAIQFDVNKKQDVLKMIKNGGFPWVAQVAMYVFTFMNTATGIPIYSIVLKYNFMSATNPVKMFRSKCVSLALAVMLPWMLSIPLYTGKGFNNLIEVGGTCFQSVVNFIVPVCLFIGVLITERRVARELAQMEKSPEQLEELCDVKGECSSTLEDPFLPQLKGKKLKRGKIAAAGVITVMSVSVCIAVYDVFQGLLQGDD